MRADHPVILDACVLIAMPLADTLLRMAEAPRLYLEMVADHHGRGSSKPDRKWQMEPDKAHRREMELRRHFPKAWVEGYDKLIEAMTNDPVIATCSPRPFAPTRI